jgi:hypothetical protein
MQMAASLPPGSGAPDFKVAITSAEVDDSTSLLTAIAAEVSSTSLPSLKLQGTIGATAGTIDLAVSIAATGSEFGTTYQTMTSFAPMLQQMAADLNSQGLYVVSVVVSQGADVTTAKLTIAPDAVKNPTSPLITGEISGEIKASTEVTATGTASFNAQDATVQALQVAISNIVNSLANQQDPASADMDVIGQIIQGLLAPPTTTP